MTRQSTTRPQGIARCGRSAMPATGSVLGHESLDAAVRFEGHLSAKRNLPSYQQWISGRRMT